MKNVAFIGEIVPIPGQEKGQAWEVYVSAESDYDHAKGRLHVRLDCVLRRRGHGREEVREAWLPGVETVTETVPSADAVNVTKDIFHSWINHVRRAIAAKTGIQPAVV